MFLYIVYIYMLFVYLGFLYTEMHLYIFIHIKNLNPESISICICYRYIQSKYFVVCTFFHLKKRASFEECLLLNRTTVFVWQCMNIQQHFSSSLLFLQNSVTRVHCLRTDAEIPTNDAILRKDHSWHCHRLKALKQQEYGMKQHRLGYKLY